MRVLLCEEPGRLRIDERPKPAPGPGEVMLRIRRIGVCGTDLHIFQGKHPYLDYPRVMGHELSGEIAAAGSGTRLAEGTAVYVMPYLTCGRCVACRAGKTNCCMSLQCLGVHCDGGMAEFLVLPESVVFPMGACRSTRRPWSSSWPSAPMRHGGPTSAAASGHWWWAPVPSASPRPCSPRRAAQKSPSSTRARIAWPSATKL